MDVSGLLLELYGRIPPLAHRAVEGVERHQLTEAPRPGANTIAWLVWHSARVQDSHVGELLEADQLWATGDWAGRFGLEPDPENTGYGHSTEQVMAVRPNGAEALLDYVHTVDERTRPMLGGLTAADLDRIVDRRWNPPVTMGVRLVSIADDCFEHLGQAAYVRGLLGA
ncbi:MAG TPA: DUF664 domain-containing protein [Acidimicrobiales bacterium]|jgi:hypothetical protein